MFEDIIDNTNLYEFIPQHLGEFPEGFDVIAYIKEIVGKIEHSSVLDFGCGSGRLSPGFCPKKYEGMDHNAKMYETAKNRFVKNRFIHADETGIPASDLFFSYMTLCQLSDKKLKCLLEQVNSKRVIVMEVMGRGWRYQKCIAPYTREVSEYQELFRAHDFVLEQKKAKPFSRYEKSPSYQHLDTNLTTLIFQKV